MKKKSVITILLAVCLMATTMIWAMANSVNFTDTLPTFTQKTLATGTKSNGLQYATTSVDATSQGTPTVWLDYQASNGDWILTSINYEISPGTSKKMNYTKSTPNIGTSVRLRVGQNFADGGKAISGNVTF